MRNEDEDSTNKLYTLVTHASERNKCETLCPSNKCQENKTLCVRSLGLIARTQGKRVSFLKNGQFKLIIKDQIYQGMTKNENFGMKKKI